LTITQLPSNGSLTLNGAMVTLNQVISITDVVNGELIFSPNADTSGNAYSNFGFKVHDNGGTTNGGLDVAVLSNTLTFDVLPVNDAPVALDSNILLLENASHVLTLADFGYTIHQHTNCSRRRLVIAQQWPGSKRCCIIRCRYCSR